MYTFTSDLKKEEYDKFIENYPMASFMQEYNWANVKDNWNSFHCGLYKDEKLVGVCLILVKKVFKNIRLFYIPRGYLIDFTNFEDLKAMTENIKKLAKENKAYVVKIDPNFCLSDNSFKDEEVEHIYSKDHEIKHNNLIKLGYKYGGVQKNMHKNLQPQYNVFAAICDKDSNILTEEELLKKYKRVKSYLGDFHKKRGVTYEISNDIKDVDRLVELLKITEKRQNINLRNKDYFVKILNSYKERAFMFFGNVDLDKYLEFLKDNNNSEEIIEVEKLKQELGSTLTLSTGLLLLPQNKVGVRTSEYIYGGNNVLLNKLHISDGLIYEMIKYSMNNNCLYCNLGGVEGTLDDRLTSFKQKFNGRIMEFIGEYDLPISKIYYPVKMFYPILIKIYRLLKNK